MLRGIDLIKLSRYENAFTLGERLRFDYEIDARIGMRVIFEIF